MYYLLENMFNYEKFVYRHILGIKEHINSVTVLINNTFKFKFSSYFVLN